MPTNHRPKDGHASGAKILENELPFGLTAYKRTPVFNENTVPPGLRREHRTKDNVWALIHVLEGKLLYRILLPPGEQVLTPEKPGVVRPGQPHDVTPMGHVQFFVEFHAERPPAGSAHATKVEGE